MINSGEAQAALAELEQAVTALDHDPVEAAKAMTYLGWAYAGPWPATIHLRWLERAAHLAASIDSPADRLSLAGNNELQAHARGQRGLVVGVDDCGGAGQILDADGRRRALGEGVLAADSVSVPDLDAPVRDERDREAHPLLGCLVERDVTELDDLSVQAVHLGHAHVDARRVVDTLPASGMLEGEVTDANDGEPVPGAVVTLTAADGGTRTVTANEQGLWKAQMLIGEHTVNVSAPGYVETTDTVTFTERGQTETLGTALATGVAELSGDGLEWLLGPDQTATAELTVTNTGSAPLEVTFAEQVDGEAADLPWFSLAGDAVDSRAELDVGESTTITATVDTTEVDPGVHTGDVLVSSNTGRAPEQFVPVTLAASAYWVGVNAGGPALTGADGFAWSADRPLSEGSWGHVGGTVEETSADIAGTEDDELFRTQRTGPEFAYVFRDAPAGTYVIDLGFAEIANVKVGRRTFDVVVDGEVVLYKHDVLAEAGAFTADTHTATVEHSGGDLTVELVGEIDKRDPILSTLKVREDPRH